jgi:hypothetical protein
MKNKKLSLFLISVILLCLSCEKIIFDFRNKYLDNWEFDVSNRYEVYSAPQGFHDTTALRIYHGKIRYGSKHSAIKFEGDGFSQEFSIDKDGEIIPENDYGPNYSESGGFEGTKIFRYHYYHHWGATRQYTATDIEGIRE